MEKIMTRTFKVQGRNGYWGVDEYREIQGQKPSGAIYSSVILDTRKSANLVASALNSAYAAGRTDANDLVKDVIRALNDLDRDDDE